MTDSSNGTDRMARTRGASVETQMEIIQHVYDWGGKKYEPWTNQDTLLVIRLVPDEYARLDLQREIDALHGIEGLRMVERTALDVSSWEAAIRETGARGVLFIGHGERSRGLQGLHNGRETRIDAHELRSMCERLEADGLGLKVIHFNVCHASELAKKVEVVVPIVVHTADAIGDEAAILFSQTFWQEMSVPGKTSALRSFTAARDRVRSHFGGDDQRGLHAPLRLCVWDRPVPDIMLIGDSDVDPYIYEKLQAAMPATRIFHIGQLGFGQLTDEGLDHAIDTAKVTMVLFDGGRVTDADTLEQVRSAVERQRSKGGNPGRLFPLYMQGTTPDRVPYGLRRLQPAFLHDPRINGDYNRFAQILQPLLR